MNLIKPIVYISFFCCIVFLIYIIVYKSYNPSTSKISTSDQALTELVQGNKEYTSFWNFFIRAKRKSVATTQRPFAIVLSCSDSRIPTEIIFNAISSKKVKISWSFLWSWWWQCSNHQLMLFTRRAWCTRCIFDGRTNQLSIDMCCQQTNPCIQ